MLTEHGLILRAAPDANITQAPRKVNARTSWPQMRNNLEKADAKMADDNKRTKESIETEKRWEDKLTKTEEIH